MLKSRLLVLSLLTTAVIMPGCFNLFPQQFPDRASIKGVVTSEKTGITLSGIKVSYGENDVTSDQDGKYSISGLAPGENLIIIANQGGENGYKEVFTQVNLSPGEEKTFDFKLLDIEPPQVTIIKPLPEDKVLVNTPIKVETIITDNEGIVNPKVFYKRSTDNFFSESSLVKTVGDIHTATIPAGVVVTEGVDFYISVEDTSGNPGNSGSSGNPYDIPVNQPGEAILILDKEIISIPVGERGTIAAIAFKSDGSSDSVVAISIKDSVATVAVSGSTITITGVAKGETTIVVTSSSGLTETVGVSVTQLGVTSVFAIHSIRIISMKRESS